MKKLYTLCLLAALCFTSSAFAQQYTITSIAGTGNNGYSGDGGPATAAEIWGPEGVAVDTADNVYIADFDNGRIRMVNKAGIISTIAGIGSFGGCCDGGPATAAQLNEPYGVYVDGSGNIYIADQGNNKIRMVNSSGIINTIAGNILASYSGDGGQATNAALNGPSKVTLDAAGNIYIADTYNSRIRKIDKAGIITTVAGDSTAGFKGDGGQATAAELYDPAGVTFDASGNLYIADANNNRIRKVNTSGVISTFAGTGAGSFSGNGSQATATAFYHPTDMVFDSKGNMYVADADNERIRVISSTGIVSTIAGNGTNGFSGDGGPATAAQLWAPTGIARDAQGNVYIGDVANQHVRKLTGTTTGIEEISNSEYVHLYPNPNNGIFSIRVNKNQLATNGEKLQVDIYNMLGEKVSEQFIIDNSTLSIDMHDKPAGLFFYRILNSNDELVSNGKFIIQ